MTNNPKDVGELRVLTAWPPVPYLLAIVLGLLVSIVLPVSVSWIWSTAAGAVTALGGVSLFVWAEVTMSAAGVSGVPRDQNARLVTAGPFRLSRNPIYVSYALFTAGIGLLFGSVWTLLFLVMAVAVIDHIVIRDEESRLTREFGAEYSTYQDSVGRWL